MPKVVYFDYWTKGIANFAAIDQTLKEHGLDTLLVHIGSDTENYSGKEEIISGIICRDISYYNTRSLSRIFQQENADAVIILNTERPFDRVVILSARAIGTPIAYMMHGQHFTNKTQQTATLKKLYAARDSITGRIKHLRRFVRYCIDYLNAAASNGPGSLFSRNTWTYLAGLIFNTSNTIHQAPISDQMHADIAMLYSKSYINYYVNDLGYPSDRVRIVGNPILDQLSTTGSITPLHLERPFAIYLDDGAVEAEQENWTNQSRLEFIRSIASSCREAGYSLLVRPHPRSDIASLKELEIIQKLQVRRSELLAEDLIDSSAVIGHTSSALMMAIRLHKPVFLAKFGIASNFYDYFYEREGAATVCNSEQDLSDKLRNIEIYSNSQELENFWEMYINPADGKSSHRIANELLALIANNRRTN